MKWYWQEIFAEIKVKYDVDESTNVFELKEILSPSDWYRLSQAIKYPNGRTSMNKFVITIHPCEVCGNPNVEYVNGETCGCEVCHEGYMNQE